MINWDDYREAIIGLYEQGISSKDTALILAQQNPEITEHHDRSIRAAITRFKQEGLIKEPKREPAKILVFDIETSPLLTWVWSLRQKYINPSNIEQDWFVICWSAKWLFEDEVMNATVTPKEARKQDDKRIVKELWDLLDEADIVIAHNGNKFDIKKMNGRFIKYDLNLPSPYQSIDTYLAARKRLNLSSLKLDFIAEYLGLPRKSSTSFQLWLDSMAGDQEALDDMTKYCDQDVRVLEDVYLKLRPFIQPHPNLGLFIESDAKVCPSCASTNLKREGQYATTVNLYDAYRCDDCGSITRSRHSSITKEEKQTITSSVPR